MAIGCMIKIIGMHKHGGIPETFKIYLFLRNFEHHGKMANSMITMKVSIALVTIGLSHALNIQFGLQKTTSHKKSTIKKHCIKR